MQQKNAGDDPTPVTDAQHPPPKFISGSLLRHILVMSGTGAVGLMAIFVGDLANIFFLSRSGDDAVVAAVGYASTILFFSTAVGIGLAIATTSLVAPALGAGLRMRARRLSANGHVLTFVVAAIFSLLLWLAVDPLLGALGAAGHTRDLASGYLAVLLPTLPMLALGMTSAAVLRSVGDAHRAMHITLFGALFNVAFDVLFIVYLGWGIDGAAIASLLSRVAIMVIGLYGVIGVHDLMGRPDPAALGEDVPLFAAIAVPAILTNVATPASNAYVTHAIAAYGDGAVAGWAIIGRVTPVAFGAIYALSGSVGPILGQNYGAQSAERMREVLTLSLLTVAAFTAFAWLVMALFAEPLADAFRASDETRELIIVFCRWLSPLFLFLGALFIANAVFNTLGRAHFSTALNWGRATLGTVPFVMGGGALGGADGVVAGNLMGGIAFGIIAVVLAYRLIDRLGRTFPSPPG